MHRLDRNNTNFSVQLREILKATPPDSKYDFLKYYQNMVRYYLTTVDVDSRGLLVYHPMGLGKSILAAAIAMEMRDTYEPVVLLAKSLQGNMEKAIGKYISMRSNSDELFPLARFGPAEIERWVKHNIQFVSMNASNMIEQFNKPLPRTDPATGETTRKAPKKDAFDAALEKKMKKLHAIDLSGKLLIVDEAHNFFRAIINGSKNAHALYHKIIHTRNMKLLFLTGTPIAAHPFELVPCFNMLANTPSNKSLFPASYYDFMEAFTRNDEMINKSYFQNRILGLVSYVAPPANDSSYPEQLPTIIENVDMTGTQLGYYNLARAHEIEEAKRKFGPASAPTNLTRPKSESSSTYRVRSRQMSNWAPPETKYRSLLDEETLAYNIEKINAVTDLTAFRSAKYERMLKNIYKHSKTLGLVYSQFIGYGGLLSFQKYLMSQGWQPYKLHKGGSDEEPGLGVVSEVESKGKAKNKPDSKTKNTSKDKATKSKNGHSKKSENDSEDISRDIPRDTPRDNPNTKDAKDGKNGKDVTKAPKYFLSITGDVSQEDRALIQEIFTSEKNMHGEICPLLLISTTGAEGLDLKNLRHIHIMEPYWNAGRPDQVIARGVRTNSHIALPEGERNVQPYIYLASGQSENIAENMADVQQEEWSTDVQLYRKSLETELLVKQFLNTIQEVSIECPVDKSERTCRMCNPTNERLFSFNFIEDIKARDPCTPLKEQSVKAQKIQHNDQTYFFTPNPNSLNKYDIYEFDDKVNAHSLLDEASPLYRTILAIIH